MDAFAEIHSLAEEALKLAQALVLTGEPSQVQQDVDAYVKLVETREPIIKKMVELKQQAGESESKEWRAAQKTMRDILALDRQQTKIIQQIMITAKASVKELRDGRRLANQYMFVPSELHRSSWDTKK